MQTDDDEYDSFADDDDSYDSYDDSHDSSEDDDDDDDKDSRRAAASGDKTKGKTAAAKKTVDKGDKNKVKGSASSKAFGNRAPRTDEEKAAEEEKRKELREVRAATRKDMRMPPLKEPDEAARCAGVMLWGLSVVVVCVRGSAWWCLCRRYGKGVACVVTLPLSKCGYLCRRVRTCKAPFCRLRRLLLVV